MELFVLPIILCFSPTITLLVGWLFFSRNKIVCKFCGAGVFETIVEGTFHDNPVYTHISSYRAC